MGTAEIQGELWGARARDWAELQEPAWRPLYEAVLLRAGVAAGTRLLDIGCGAGGALVEARQLGSKVSGLDASEPLTTVARERLPGARIEVGEMEQLPFEDRCFDVVTGFNSFQFAGDVAGALGEARRVCRLGGKVATMVWGRKEECELITAVLPAMMALIPPPPPSGGPAPLDFGSPGVLEGLMERAGLLPQASGDLDAVFEYPDAATAVRALSSAGPATRAARHAGEEALRNAVSAALARFTRSDGSVALKNRFRLVVAARCA
jgi:SAM-dependent methyltransferase